MTRMRCWRITSINSSTDETSSSPTAASGSAPQKKMELSVEYLMSKDNLRWITLITDQAILMSMCLQVCDALWHSAMGFDLEKYYLQSIDLLHCSGEDF